MQLYHRMSCGGSSIKHASVSLSVSVWDRQHKGEVRSVGDLGFPALPLPARTGGPAQRKSKKPKITPTIDPPSGTVPGPIPTLARKLACHQCEQRDSHGDAKEPGGICHKCSSCSEVSWLGSQSCRLLNGWATPRQSSSGPTCARGGGSASGGWAGARHLQAGTLHIRADLYHLLGSVWGRHELGCVNLLIRRHSEPKA